MIKDGRDIQNQQTAVFAAENAAQIVARENALRIVGDKKIELMDARVVMPTSINQLIEIGDLENKINFR
ncbi:MAG: hypothetical protein EZS28_008023 [Streblomastix strix]|uniref:Uncharacterized protein n=1 Tax=Streblomastix strix TaxID=222440 RepID=A0A5J4WPA5_9EUKA|nr:MAG: hypothetical protein EZS28_008023 [Streblomastix strix]